MAWSSRGQKESLHTLHRVRLYSQTGATRERNTQANSEQEETSSTSQKGEQSVGIE